MAGLVLAAGAGRRLGRPKALLRHDGQFLVERAVALVRSGGCDWSYVVVGAAADDVRLRADLGDATVVENPGWDEGIGSSVRSGLTAVLADESIRAAVIVLVDQPFVGAAAVRRVIDAHRDGAAVAMAKYGDRRGHPVLLARPWWSDVRESAVGDAGARPFLRRHEELIVEVDCADTGNPTDIDVPADLALLAGDNGDDDGR